MPLYEDHILVDSIWYDLRPWERAYMVLRHSDPTIALTYLSPKERWKMAYRAERLRDKKIVEHMYRGVVGTFSGVSIVEG